MNRILLVEDEDNLREQLSSFLVSQGFVVTGRGSIALAQKEDPGLFDLAILDWNLKDGEGVDLVKAWRGIGSRLPVIMLTARTDVIDRVVGLEIGANDYVLKPYEPRELLARIRAQLRAARGVAGGVSDQTGRSNSEVIQCGEFQINLDERAVRFRGTEVDLTKMEFDLLLVLARAAGKVFTRDELLTRVWGLETSTETRTVDAHIGKLRQKFGEDSIETVRGLGYRIPRAKGGA